MKNKTAIISTFLAVVMLFLVACSNNSNENNSAPNTPNNSGNNVVVETETPAVEPAEITFMTYDGVKNAEGQYKRQLQVDAFNKANPDIVVTLDLQEGDSVEFLKKLDLLTLGGADYDVVALPSYKDYAERALKGLFAPVDEYIEAEGTTYDKVYSFQSEVDGVNYALPYNSSIYHVLLNKTMLDEANLPVPPLDWSWEDYRTYAKALTKGEGANKVYGSYMHTWSEYRREALFSTKLDNPYIKDDGTSNLADPVFKEWLQFVYDMENVDKSQVSYKDAKATNMAYRDVFFTGKAGMILTGSWIYSNITDVASFPHDFNTVFAMMPTWGDGPVGRVTGSSTYNAINKNSENKEAAYKFMKFISGEGAAIANEFSAMLGADNSATVESIAAGNEALLDKESLLGVWNHPNLTPNSINKFPAEFALLDTIFNVETEMFMLGGQDIDKTISNLIKQSEDALKK